MDNASFEAATRRGAERLKKTPVAVGAHYDRRTGRVVITMSTGVEIGFKPHDAQGLEHSRPSDLENIEISPSGLGVHFPALDADLYIPSLIEGMLGSKSWTASRLGKAGGSATSEAKTRSSRANGRLGGLGRKRPIHCAPCDAW